MSRILVAEDDPLQRLGLEGALTSGGYEVMTAADGAEALARVRAEGPFDLLLLDRSMPGLDGCELLRRLRREGVRTVAMFCSGDLVLTASDRARLGVVDVLTKPVSRSHLISAVRRALASRHP